MVKPLKFMGNLMKNQYSFRTPWSGSKDELWANLKQIKFHATPN
ncbi:hypothetical protein C427_0613 [Paraglaciecola psychrophila 170]|uniref:Uncharacterized protein n=1 Tax=Paraglaciecola psychrophila 170 TaxID=1129794 RepID=K7A9I5_9ALTE|nr:hypothetical protein C427_0613 [Paraglaciecola psychrophila 170]GAC38957.1 hypothetical protein GPSY_3346 [Paraglaciecola psychrophila 170]